MATRDPPETSEYRIFRERYDILIQSIKDPLPLATRLFTQGVVTSAVKEHMSVVGLSTLDKSNVLLGAVEKQIQSDPQKFHVFLSVLNEDPSVQLLVESMQRGLFSTTSGVHGGGGSVESRDDGGKQSTPELKRKRVGDENIVSPTSHLEQESVQGFSPHHGMLQQSGQLLHPRSFQYPSSQGLCSGVGGLQTTFALSQPRQVNLLIDSILKNDVDQFHQHLDELQRILQDPHKLKEVLGGNGALCYAAYVGSNSMVETLIQKGVDINTMSAVPEDPKLGYTKRTPLHWATKKGHANTVRYFVEAGADPNIQDKFGETCLHWAVGAGQVDIVKCLVAKGANVNIEDLNGRTPLAFAHHPLMMPYLQGANPKMLGMFTK